MSDNTGNYKKNIRLMNKNTEVVKFNGRVVNKKFPKDTDVPYLQADSIHVTDETRCPIFLSDKTIPQEKQLEWFNNWLNRRCVSEKRRDIPVALKYAKKGNADFPHLFSLYDQYWLKFNETEKWEDYNFFDNDYSTTFGDFCFSLNKDNFKSNKNLFYNPETPDITTGGIVPKAWKKIDGTNYLFKYELPDKSQTPLNEIMASHFLSRLNIIDFVNYEYGIYEFTTCSKCACFVDSDHEFIPMSDLYNLHTYANKKAESQNNNAFGDDRIYRTLVDIINKYDIRNGVSFINKMIIADTMLMNSDRHLGNFGVLRNVNTGKIEKFAPLFDFGSAFFEFDKEKKRLFSKDRVKQAFTGYFKERIPPKGIYGELTVEINNGYYFDLGKEQTTKLKKDLLVHGSWINDLIKNGNAQRKKVQKQNKSKDKNEPTISYGLFENV